MAHYFRLKCLNTDKILKKQLENTSKRKSEATSEAVAAKKPCIAESPKKLETGNFQKVFLKSICTERSVEKKMAELHKEKEEAGSSSADDDLESILASLEGKEQFVIENNDVQTPKKKLGKKKTKWILPKAVEVVRPEQAEVDSELRSEIGDFEAEVIESVYNNNFCLADKYLFEFGLVKQGQR